LLARGAGTRRAEEERGMRTAAIIAMLLAPAIPSPAGTAGGGGMDSAMKIHRGAVVFDAHCDTAMRLVGEGPIDLGERRRDGHIDLPRALEGGLDAQIFAVWVSPQLPETLCARRAEAMIGAIHEQARRHADRMEIALDGRDVSRIVKRGKLAAIVGIEGGHVIGDDPAVLRGFYERGVRCLTLTWMNTNKFADSSDDTTLWRGLNDRGREIVREMDRLGMIVDCAHVSEETVRDVLAVTKRPVIVSHSCMRALCDIPRNVSDDVLRAVAAHGGVVCVNFFPGFLDKGYHERVSALWVAYRERAREIAPAHGGDRELAWRAVAPELERETAGIPPVPLSRLVDHIDHAVGIAGIDHVGLGSDFDGISTTPAGLEDVSKLPLVTAELVKRGYTKREIEKILGGNLLRVVEKAMR
jgi:membrane dipeptidase